MTGRYASNGGRGWADPPSEIHAIVQDTVNKRAVRIIELLEFILAESMFSFEKKESNFVNFFFFLWFLSKFSLTISIIGPPDCSSIRENK